MGKRVQIDWSTFSTRVWRVMGAIDEWRIKRISPSLPYPWTIDDLCWWSRADLLRLPGLGRGSVQEIERWVEAQGRHLRSTSATENK